MAEFLPVAPRVVGNPDQWEMIYHSGRRWPSRDAALREGYGLANDTDDFLIAEVDGKALVGVTCAAVGYEELTDWKDEDYQEIAAALGLRLTLKAGEQRG